MRANIQELINLANEAEKRGVEMSKWLFKGQQLKDNWECGTVGCLAGTYAVMKNMVTQGPPKGIFESSFTLPNRHWTWIVTVGTRVRDALGLTTAEYAWVFLLRSPTGPTRTDWLHIINTDRAVERLRKLIYFKIKQNEINAEWNDRLHTRHAQAKNRSYLQYFDSNNLKEVVSYDTV